MYFIKQYFILLKRISNSQIFFYLISTTKSVMKKILNISNDIIYITMKEMQKWDLALKA